MKTFRLIGMASFAVLLSVGFDACSSNVDDDDNGGTSSDKRLVKMTEQGESNTYTYVFTYDSQGRVVRKDVKRDGILDYYYIYAYFDDLIVQKYYNDRGYSKEYSLTLENGLIVSEEEKSWVTQYAYENGRLATKTNDNGVYSFKWENGNVTRIDLNGESHTKYEYTNYAAPKSFFTYSNRYGKKIDLGLFYGKSAKNLPSKLIEGDDGITYDWTVKDGLPIKLIEMEKDDHGTYTTITTFEWE